MTRTTLNTGIHRRSNPGWQPPGRHPSHDILRAASLFRVTLWFAVLLLCGCAGRFPIIRADNPTSALRELMGMRARLVEFHADARFELAGSKGSLRTKGSIDYKRDEGLDLELRGPFGMTLATLHVDDRICIVDSPHNGVHLETDPEEEIFLPELDITIPNPRILARLLIPLTELETNSGVKIRETILLDGNDYRMRLTGRDGRDIDLTLSLTPVRLLEESVQRQGAPIYSRRFEYESGQASAPHKVTISMEDFSLTVTYNSTRIKLTQAQA